MAMRYEVLTLQGLFLTAALLIGQALSHGHGSTRTVTTTSGSGGEACGNGICLDQEGVSCVAGRCSCGPGRSGDGLLVCASPGERVCQGDSDPLMKSFSNEYVAVPVTGKFLMSVLETKAMVGGSIVGECILQISSWGTKGQGAGRRGKHFVAGMEVEATIMIGEDVYYHATRVYGGARMGVYKFIEQGNDSPMASGPWGKDLVTIIPGVGVIETVYDVDNNIAKFQAGLCGVFVGYRSQERSLMKELTPDLTPGVYLKVMDLHEPNYLSSETSLCFAPLEHGITLKGFIQRLERDHDMKVSRKVAMMYRLFKSSSAQIFPNAPSNLQSLVTTAQECNEGPLLNALDRCLFVLETSKFLKCWIRPSWIDGGDQDFDDDEEEDEHNAEIMNAVLLLMHTCMESYCGHSALMCQIVQKNIRRSSCHHLVPSSRSIMDFDCNELRRST